jgi:hypothetical protein
VFVEAAIASYCEALENKARGKEGEEMTEFKVGDVVRIIGGSNRRWRIDSLNEDKARIVFRKKLDYGTQLVDFKDIVLVDPQADIKQAIREVLLSDEFIAAFAAAFRSATVQRYTFSPVAGVNRPMRNKDSTSEGGKQ